MVHLTWMYRILDIAVSYTRHRPRRTPDTTVSLVYRTYTRHHCIVHQTLVYRTPDIHASYTRHHCIVCQTLVWLSYTRHHSIVHQTVVYRTLDITLSCIRQWYIVHQISLYRASDSGISYTSHHCIVYQTVSYTRHNCMVPRHHCMVHQPLEYRTQTSLYDHRTLLYRTLDITVSYTRRIIHQTSLYRTLDITVSYTRRGWIASQSIQQQAWHCDDACQTNDTDLQHTSSMTVPNQRYPTCSTHLPLPLEIPCKAALALVHLHFRWA